ncbi:Retrovirus-related Pol polyprotein from transposon, partial [Smittium culicis]
MTDKSESSKDSSDSHPLTSTYNIPQIFPGTAGAPVFNGEDLLEFLAYYEIITSKNSSLEKTMLFPFYCVQKVRSKVTKSIAYAEKDWEQFKVVLRDYYQLEESKDKIEEELYRLMKKGTSLKNVKTYLHQFEYLLQKQNKISPISDREKRELLIKSIYQPDLVKVQSHLYNNKGDFLTYAEISNKLITLSNMEKNLQNIIGSSISEPGKFDLNRDDKDVSELSKLMEKMCLKMNTVIDTISTTISDEKATDKYKRKIRCIYCDEAHRRVDCEHFKKDNEAGLVKMGTEGFIENNSGVRMPTNWGKGGIRTLIKNSQATSRQIKLGSLEDMEYALEWNGDTDSTFVNEGEFSKLVNAFASKRTLDNGYPEKTSNKKGKTINENLIENLDNIPLIERLGEQKNNKSTESQSIDDIFNPVYKMTSKILSKDSENIVSKKLKEVQVSLTLQELFSVSPSVRKRFNEEIRVRREPIVNLTSIENAQLTEKPDNSPVKCNSTSSSWKDFYLSAGSGKVKGSINGAGVEFLLDEGSEINIMNIDVFNALRSLNKIEIDSSINWSLRDANQGFSQLNGVCKNCNISIEGTVVSVPVFVSANTEPQVILGRPWERKARVLKDNRDDGTLWYTIKDAETGAVAKFCAVGSNDSRSFPERKNDSISKNEKTPVFFTLVNRINAAWEAIAKTDYTTEVRTRYKKANEKIKPVPHALPPYQSSTQENFPKNNIIKIIPDEKLSELCIGNDNLLPTEVEYFKTKLKPLGNVFAFNENEIGLLDTNIEKPITVHTVPHIPWSFKSYPQPKAIWEQIKSLIKSKMEQGVLEPGRGSYSNRWFCINKKNSNKLRFIQDVRPVNEVTIKNASVPPVAEEFAEDFAGRPIYSTFDLISGYDQVQISEDSRDLFGLQTPLGLLRMTRLPMGWSNSVQEFQRIMYKIFFEFIPEKMGLFIDDGCIKGSRNKDLGQDILGVRNFVKEHVDDVVKILGTLQNTGMTINAKKCKFGVSEVEIVGFICSENGRKPLESKIKKILSWPIPSNLKELRGFLGLTCFYRVWIKSYSVISDPLYHLLRKDQAFEWTQDQNTSFEALKNLISTPPILQAPKYEKDSGKFILTIDASPVGAGGVLHQMNQNGELNPCRFESYCFNARERRYSQVKRELFAIFKILKKFRMYLYGIKFILETDCKPLIGLLNKPDLPNDVASRWIGYILNFDFEMRHIKGEENLVADALSRYSFQNPEYLNTFTIGNSKNSNISRKNLCLETIYKILEGDFESISYVGKTKIKSIILNYFIRDGTLFKRSANDRVPRRVVFKEIEKKNIICELHTNEGGGHRGRDATCRKINDRIEEPLTYTYTPTLFGKFGIDIVLMPKGIGNKSYLIVARDDLSGWVEAKALSRNDSASVWKFISEDILSRFGIVNKLVADRGEVNSNLIKDLAKKYGLKLSFTTSYHPQTNGMVERGHVPLVSSLSKYCGRNPSQWPKYLHLALWADRITAKRTTGEAQYKLVYGQDCVLPIESEYETWNTISWKKEMTTEELLLSRIRQLDKKSLLIEEASNRQKNSRKKDVEYFNNKHKIRDTPLKVGEMVLQYDKTLGKQREQKLSNRWYGPYVITKDNNNGSYNIRELNGVEIKLPISG